MNHHDSYTLLDNEDCKQETTVHVSYAQKVLGYVIQLWTG